MDEHTISPAGDPFYAASRRDDQDERPHFCYDGWVFLGRVVELPDGDEEIVHEPVPCRRCAGDTQLR